MGGGPALTSNVGNFILVDGVNTFRGSIFTPDDPSDAFNITLAPNVFLTGASLVFAENVDTFKPYFGFPSPSWGLYESETTPTIFEEAIPDTNSAFVAFTIVPSFSERGPGTYNLLIGNGTFGMSRDGRVDYTMTFTAEFRPLPPPQTAPIPLPGGLVLLLTGLGITGFVAGRRNAGTGRSRARAIV